MDEGIALYERSLAVQPDMLDNAASSNIAPVPTLEATQGQIDAFFIQLPLKCYLPEVASLGG